MRFGRQFSRLVAVLAFGSSSCAWAEGYSYSFDKDHTAIVFSWNHMGLSRQSARVTDYAGALTLDPANPEATTVEVVMKAASISTGVAALDRHLRSADFFDVAHHPAITFHSTAVRKTGDKSAEMTGDLTVLGLTKPVTLAVTFNGMGDHPFAKFNPNYAGLEVAGFTASGVVQRSAFGLTRIMQAVPDEIEIRIEAEFVRRKP